jgi:hypothetical protein
MSKFSSKKRNDIAPEVELVSLMSNQDGRPMQSRDRRRKIPSSFSLPSKPSSKNRGAKKRNNMAPQEERVSLIGNDGKPTPSPDQRGSHLQDQRPPWTFSRLMRYLSLTAVSAMVTFIILRKESKVLHWEEYHYLLEPAGPREERCYVSIFLCLVRKWIESLCFGLLYDVVDRMRECVCAWKSNAMQFICFYVFFLVI